MHVAACISIRRLKIKRRRSTALKICLRTDEFVTQQTRFQIAVMSSHRDSLRGLEQNLGPKTDATRRLATTNRSRDSMSHKISRQGRWRGLPCKTFHPIQFDHHVKFDYFFSYQVLACKSSQDIFRTLLPRGPPVPLGHGAWLNPTNTPVLRLSYHAEFGRSRSNRMGVSRTSPKFGGAWPPVPYDWAFLPPSNTSIHHKSSGWCVITEILQKCLTLRVPSFQVTQGHWNEHGSIGYL